MRLFFSIVALIVAPTVVAAEVAAKEPLAGFFASFSETDYFHWMPRPGQQLLGGVMSKSSETHLFIHKKEPTSEQPRAVNVNVLSFRTASEAVRAANGYLKEAEPVRGHAIGWELVVPIGPRIYWMTTGRELPKSRFDELSGRFLDGLGAKSLPHMVCQDIGNGCWMEGA